MTHIADQSRTTMPDERGIDAAITVFLATRVTGGTMEEATRYTEAVLNLFGFEKPDDNPLPSTTPAGAVG